MSPLGGLSVVAVLALSAGGAASATDPAPPVDVADLGAFTGIARIDVASSCTATLVDTGVEDGPAYLLTNGHCAAGIDAGANEIVLDDPGTGAAVFAPQAEALEGVAAIQIVGVPYSTMKGRDVSIAELGITLGEAREAGLRPLAIAAHAPAAGDAVVNVGIPVVGIPSAEWVLRRGECALGAQADLVEFVWHFDDSWATDCPGIRGGSSGSPLLDTAGRIVAMINTTTAGAPPGGDCYLGKPCEVSAAGIEVVADTSYAVPVAGIERCFGTDGVFDVAAAGCVLEPGGGVTARIDIRAVQPLDGRATTTAILGGPEGTEFATKVVTAAERCTGADGYGGPSPLVAGMTVDVEVPGDEGIHKFCVAEPGAERFASTAVVQVDGTPPVVDPELSIRGGGDQLLVEPLFAVPELSDFLLQIGPAHDTDCADDDAYIRYRRIPLTVRAEELPVAVCVIGSDEAGNEGAPYRHVIEDEDL